MPNGNETASKTHSEVKLIDRRTLNITGLDRVLGATPEKVSIIAAGTGLLITGSDLHVERLDVAAGIIDIVGEVCELRYRSARQGNFFSRLIK